MMAIGRRRSRLAADSSGGLAASRSGLGNLTCPAGLTLVLYLHRLKASDLFLAVWDGSMTTGPVIYRRLFSLESQRQRVAALFPVPRDLRIFLVHLAVVATPDTIHFKMEVRFLVGNSRDSYSTGPLIRAVDSAREFAVFVLRNMHDNR